MIKHKKAIDVDELWFCLAWLLQLANELIKDGLAVLDGISLDKIFLTLKGAPVIYVHHLVHHE